MLKSPMPPVYVPRHQVVKAKSSPAKRRVHSSWIGQRTCVHQRQALGNPGCHEPTMIGDALCNTHVCSFLEVRYTWAYHIISIIIISPCQYTGLTWAFQFYRGPRPILWKCPFGTLYKIKILTDTYIISPIKSQPASNPSMSSNPKTLQNCSAQVKLVHGISSKLASIKLGPSKMAWS